MNKVYSVDSHIGQIVNGTGVIDAFAAHYQKLIGTSRQLLDIIKNTLFFLALCYNIISKVGPY